MAKKCAHTHTRSSSSLKGVDTDEHTDIAMDALMHARTHSLTYTDIHTTSFTEFSARKPLPFLRWGDESPYFLNNVESISSHIIRPARLRW
jgi:hypothetical protein